MSPKWSVPSSYPMRSFLAWSRDACNIRGQNQAWDTLDNKCEITGESAFPALVAVTYERSRLDTKMTDKTGVPVGPGVPTALRNFKLTSSSERRHTG